MPSYFNIHNTPEENKIIYKTLCKKLHPDMPGGTESEFIEMKKQYDFILENQTQKEYYQFKQQNNNDLSELEKIFNVEAQKLKKEAHNVLKNAGITSIDDVFDLVGSFIINNIRKNGKR